MSYLWVKLLVIIVFVLLAWLFSFCSKSCRLGRPLGYFLAGVLGVYLFNKFSPNSFQVVILDDEIISHFLKSFVFAYLGLHFFKTTQYLKIKEIRKYFKINIFIMVIYFSIIYLFSYFFPNFAIISLIFFSPYLINHKRFLQRSNLKPLFYQFFLFQAIITICIVIIEFFYDKINLLKNNLFYVIPLIIIFSLLSYWRSHNHHSKNIKELKEVLAEDSLPSKKLFYFIFLIFFTCTYFLSNEVSVYFFSIIALIILGFFTANFLNKKIYHSFSLLDKFYLGEILFFLYLAFYFNSQLDIKKFALFLIYKLILSLLLYLFLKLKYREKDVPLYIIFVLSSVYSVFLFAGGGEGFSFLILLEVIGNALFHLSLRKKKSSTIVTEVDNENFYSLKSLIDQRVIFDIDVRNIKDAIKMLLNQLIKEAHFSDMKELIPLIMEREKDGGTALGQRVAIPHCRISGLNTSIVVCGILKKGESLKWNAPDNLGVKYIFLIISPKDDTNIHIKTLQKITEFAMDTQNIEDLVIAKGENKLDEFFLKYEAR